MSGRNIQLLGLAAVCALVLFYGIQHTPKEHFAGRQQTIQAAVFPGSSDSLSIEEEADINYEIRGQGAAHSVPDDVMPDAPESNEASSEITLIPIGIGTGIVPEASDEGWYGASQIFEDSSWHCESGTESTFELQEQACAKARAQLSIERSNNRFKPDVLEAQKLCARENPGLTCGTIESGVLEEPSEAQTECDIQTIQGEDDTQICGLATAKLRMYVSVNVFE